LLRNDTTGNIDLKKRKSSLGKRRLYNEKEEEAHHSIVQDKVKQHRRESFFNTEKKFDHFFLLAD
jgi:hypothetical protein